MKKFAPLLLRWYAQHKRTLPWRDIKDPYKIWISEIILQQTRVAQGYEYFVRFIRRFPNVNTLAAAPEDEVMKYWQGLGYYSRARNLHAAAKSMKGVFPTTYEGVRALKGVGDYTAAAICSFAYNMPYAVVDGNVYRVLARIFGINTPIDCPSAKKQFAELAQQLLDTKNPHDYNQAIMDFGAIHCTPQAPKCLLCPMGSFCVARRKGLQEKLPVKAQKTKISTRYFHYIYVKQGKFTWLHKRGAGDVWQNLYEPPLVETPTETLDRPARTELKRWFGAAKVTPLGISLKHVLSHRVIYANLYKVSPPPTYKVPPEFMRICVDDLPKYAVSRLVQKLLENMQ